ncbi:MAG: hypothetical protein PHT19_08420 [Methylococcus sp.]|nr:hypothetical protein [Methylococcus sp.]
MNPLQKLLLALAAASFAVIGALTIQVRQTDTPGQAGISALPWLAPAR